MMRFRQNKISARIEPIKLYINLIGLNTITQLTVAQRYLFYIPVP